MRQASKARAGKNRAAGTLAGLYQRLLLHYGPQHWWPGDTPFEVAVGAVLTQNTSWSNVARAIANLKGAEVLSLDALLALTPSALAGLIRPAGYYNLKEKRLRNLLTFLAEPEVGGLQGLGAMPLGKARQLVLAVKGVGPETADSILLYACGQPTFVIDAYTFRILGRHGLAPGLEYHDLQAAFTQALPADPALYNEYHGLLVRLGKEQCGKSKPRCEGCPAQGWSLNPGETPGAASATAPSPPRRLGPLSSRRRG